MGWYKLDFRFIGRLFILILSYVALCFFIVTGLVLLVHIVDAIFLPVLFDSGGAAKRGKELRF